ncbi:two-component system KDP operon response regulator KdpE [Novosphingobium hassiacum]|uniref:Two-component system KDP operon response regulator KdpE n=1 Tax=Novosphingobium hassiacum TaxID=173676 RepID=A0A7W5ZUX3_9SPHN|nr:response regulator transcription factor [Novosphingobium hassiacum]MBB3859543.1 two-component system KDP operon response regulator KdpE [Novosphingobium hassiacum]
MSGPKTGGVTILVVDDEPAIRRLLRASLTRVGYTVVEAGTAREALAALHIDKPEVVLLDLGLPDRDGLEMIPLIRTAGVAVIVVSARDATEQKVAALDLGADDYVSKPFDSDEVLARIRAALRHRLASETAVPVVYSGEVEIDLGARIVRRAGEEVHLTPKEYAMLAELAKSPGRVVTHSQLLKAVWGPGHESDVEYLRVAARGIRRKLESDPAQPQLIRNEPGVGYRLLGVG